MARTPPETAWATTVDAPCGPLLCVVDADGALLRIEFAKGRSPGQVRHEVERDGRLALVFDEKRTRAVRRQLAEYFAGTRTAFDLPLAPRGTEFQRAVWAALARIPYGETRSYADVAREIGRPRAVRAVGRANGANPIPVVVPCHRVVGRDGSLTGFGGGLEVKALLLAHEAGQREPAPG